MNEVLTITSIPLILLVATSLLSQASVIRALNAVGFWILFILILTILWPVASGAKSLLCVLPDLCINQSSAILIYLTSLVSAVAASQCQIYFAKRALLSQEDNPAEFRSFYIFFNLFILGMIAVFMCENLGMLWISIEATTLFSAPLIYFFRSKESLEATWKYLIICSVGIAFALLGTVLIFASSQASIESSGSLLFSELISRAPTLHGSLLKLGFLFCVLGYGTKAGLFPLHSWLPDAYSQAPAPVAAVFSGALSNCAIYALLKVSQILCAAGQGAFVFNILGALGAVTVLAAAIFLVRQHSLKRLLAYSSIENTGLMVFAVALNAPGLFVLQAINHSFAKVALFLLAGNVCQTYGTPKLSRLHGLLRVCPLWGVLIMLASLAVTGSPPFGAFSSELAILVHSATASGWIYGLTIVISLCLAFLAVLANVGKLLLGDIGAEALNGLTPYRPIVSSILPALLILGTLALGFCPLSQVWEGLK